MRTRVVTSTAVWDILLLVGSMVVASLLVFGDVVPWLDPRAGIRVVPLLSFMLGGAVLVSLLTIGMAPPGVPRPSYGRGWAIVGGTLLLVTAGLFVSRAYFSRTFVIATFATWAVAATMQRAIRRRRPWIERIVIITSEKHLADELGESTHAETVAVIDPQTEDDIELYPTGTTLAVDMRAVLSERVAQYVSSCDIAGYPIRSLASVYEEHTGRIPLVHLAEGWEITTPLSRTNPFLPGKRLFDLAIVVLASPVWLPLMAFVAAAVKVSSPGPVIFAQRRIGMGGEPFTLYKFRTMFVGADSGGPRMARPGDDRIVRGGTLLRRLRLDELPQLWNVLTGDMSLVGPRAEQIPFVRMFRKRIPFYDLRHLVRPGITGWAQVSFRYAEGATDTVEKLAYDLYYVKHMSPVLDLQILWKTVWTVLTGAGAR